jgi:hypothetical protein
MISRRQFLLNSVATGAGLATGPARLLAAGERPEPICSATGCYTRMFPQLARPPSHPTSKLEKGLEELGRKMTDDDKGEEGTVTAGYTYLGQFIDHDLTLDITPLELAQPYAERTPNFRTPFLDLDQVYGGGPSLSPFLYEMNGPPGNERFLIGMTTNRKCKGREFTPSPDDLPRNSKGIALVGDPREDENLIIAQLHVAFLKFHNRVMDELEKGEKGKVQSAGPAGATPFEQARRLVIWHYQYIVLNDFLVTLIDPEIFKDVQQKCAAPVDGSGHFRIPIEFSVAAFRFGHSMVRDVYGFYNSCHDNVDLQCLLAFTGSGSKGIPCKDLPDSRDVPFALPADWVIGWNHFFLSSPHIPQLNDAQKIDTKIANGLHDLQPQTVKLFNASMPSQHRQLTAPENILPVRTLWRGARIGLPSGQDVARALCLKPLESEIAPADGPHTEILTAYGLVKDTPLWYYVLKEAELNSKREKAPLGPVGSRIIADVIVGALRADPNSYLSINPSWKPNLADKPKMIDILEFINANG